MVFSDPHIDSIQEVVVINNTELFAAKFSTKTVERKQTIFLDTRWKSSGYLEVCVKADFII